MKTTLQSVIKYTIWAFIFAGATYAYAVGTWSEPTGTPPANNVDAPLNIGSVLQTKTGQLWADGGIGTMASGYFGTTLAVGTTTDPGLNGLTALFNSKVGATSYCDANGENCSTASEISNNTSSPANTGKVVYLQNDYSSNSSYTKSLSSSASAGSAFSVSVTPTWSLAELRSNITEIAAESRTIVGLVVNSYLTVTPPGTADSVYYEFLIIKENSSYFTSELVYAPALSVGIGGTSQDVTVMDYDSNTGFSLTASVRRPTLTNLNNGTVINGIFKIIGYIVE